MPIRPPGKSRRPPEPPCRAPGKSRAPGKWAALATLCVLGALVPAAPARAETASGLPAGAEAASGLPEVPPDPRRAQLSLHQALGLGTLGALSATGIAGLAYYQQRFVAKQAASSLSGLSTAHLALAAVSGATYLTAATLALSAPEPAAEPAPEAGYAGLDSVAIHRGLAVLHAAGIASTIALGLLSARSDPSLTETHRLLGFGTFGLMTASAAVIAIDF